MSWHAPTPGTGLVIDMIRRELETDTNWENVDIRIGMFEEAHGYDTTEAKTPFQIFTKLLGVGKDHPKWKQVKDRYYSTRRHRVRELADEGLSQRAIAEQLGVDASTVNRDLLRYNEKPQQPREVSRYQITSYTKSETAAEKLLATFGHDWCQQLMESLRKGLTNG